MNAAPLESCPECHGVGKNDLGDECDCWDVYLNLEKYRDATRAINEITAKVGVWNKEWRR